MTDQAVAVAITAPHRSVEVSWTADRPVSLDALAGSGFLGRPGVPLVEVFTAAEQRARTSQAYTRSAVGARLRYVAHAQERLPDATALVLTQHDDHTGLSVRTRIVRPAGTRAIRLQTTIENTGDHSVMLTAISTATIGFGSSEADLDDVRLATARSEWLAENRWQERPLRSLVPSLTLSLHGQDARGHAAQTSHGAWSTGEHLPTGVLTRVSTDEALAWQIETSGPWHRDIAQSRDGGVLSLLGPTDLEHQFAHELRPGASFTTVPVAVAGSPEGRDGAIAELTRYRRWLRPERSRHEPLPLIYNDFMNTLMGQPSTAALVPLIDTAAQVGAECFCIDAGWFADPEIGDWWSTVGDWREHPRRFDGGLRALVDRIHSHGMRSGIWLEPEVVGVDSPLASRLPEEAFFTRFGTRVREHDRYHLDFRHPSVRAHLDATVDHLVADYGFSFLKLDYNINPGAGTEWLATSPGDGLLSHTRAFQSWLVDLHRRHPQLLIENCSSGAMRADYSLLSVTHLQSTSDQQDFLRYPPIAASAPASILPEQCGNWAYPHADMSLEETAFTLVTGLAGRLYLSGFLHRLSDEQRALVADAAAVHTALRRRLPEVEPFWPLGLPGWDDPVICLGLRDSLGELLFIWDRHEEKANITLPGIEDPLHELFPRRLTPWRTSRTPGGTVLHTITGASARAYRVGGEPRG